MCEPRYGAQPQRTQCSRSQAQGGCRSKIRQQQEPRSMYSPPPPRRNPCREPEYEAQPQRTQCTRAQQQGPCRSKIQQRKESQCCAQPPPEEYEKFDIVKQLPAVCRQKCPTEYVPAACKYLNEFIQQKQCSKQRSAPQEPQVQCVSAHDTLGDMNITTATMLQFSSSSSSEDEECPC